MPTTGIDKLPYPNSGDIPDGPAAFLTLGQRLSLMKGAGIGYAEDGTALAAMITSGDAFTGLNVYHAAADAVVKYNGATFKLANTKLFVDASARAAWTAAYSGLLEAGSVSQIGAGSHFWVWSGSAWNGSFNLRVDGVNSVIASNPSGGIEKITGANAVKVTKVVTFPVAYSSIPVVKASSIGGRLVGAFDPSGLITVGGTEYTIISGITTTGFTVDIRRADVSNLTSAFDYYFSWSADGVKA